MSRPPDSTHPNRAAFPAGMSSPALRTLDVAGVRSVRGLERWTEVELLALHGMGPKGIRLLRDALEESGWRFRQP